VLRVAGPPAGPKSVWQRILGQARAAEWAAPVLLDDRNQPHFPTGDVTVRFTHAPSQTDLERFAKAHGLHLRGRNAFVPDQACFTPARPRGTYLPELLQSLADTQGVAAAWANTLSRYRRTGAAN
jgi:hypothetical protein